MKGSWYARRYRRSEAPYSRVHIGEPCQDRRFRQGQAPTLRLFSPGLEEESRRPVDQRTFQPSSVQGISFGRAHFSRLDP